MKFDLYMADTVNAIIPYTHDELCEFRKSITPSDLDELKAEQAYLLDIPLQTIVNNKKTMSQDKHLYESFSIYTWKNPNTESGLPYIVKDGYINYDHLKADKENLRMVSFLTYHLGILYFFTKEQKYYDALKQQLQSFFINEDTKMLPDLRHGQSRPGVDQGSPSGIIDIGISFGYSLSILISLKKEGLLEESLYEPLKQWMSDLLIWLKKHPFGLQMSRRFNNHSLVYDYFTLILSRFIGSEELEGNIKQRFIKAVFDQISEDGKMPLELARTKSRSYTMMNSKLFFEIYKFLQVDFDEAVIERVKNAIDFYLPIAAGNQAWIFQQTQEFYHFYDINFIYAINRYFGYNASIRLKQEELELGKWTHYLNRSVVNIIRGEK